MAKKIEGERTREEGQKEKEDKEVNSTNSRNPVKPPGRYTFTQGLECRYVSLGRGGACESDAAVVP